MPVESVDVPGGCPFCDDALRLRYEDGTLRLTCGTESHALALPGSPSLLDGPSESAVERVSALLYHQLALARRGVCSECHGRVEGTVHAGDVTPEHYHYDGECQRCGFHHAVPAGMAALPHPAVLGFFADHDVDVRSTPFWELDFCTPGGETVTSTTPLRLRFDATLDGETLSATLAADGSVVSTRRGGVASSK